MKSHRLVEYGKPLEMEELPDPHPKDTQVLLRVLAAGICHSDLHLSEGGYDLGGGKRLMVKDRGVRLPLTLGHETVGQAIAHGPTADVKLGRTYLVFPWIGCGECKICEAGDENLCARPRSLGVYQDGGYSDHLLVPHSRYLLDVTGLDPAVCASYACSGLTAFSALKKAGSFLTSDLIVIFGAGGLGLQSVRLLKALGGKGAVVVDIDKSKREAALEAGAVAALDGNAPDAIDRIAAVLGEPPRAAIDFVGSEQTASIAFGCLAKGGKLITVGLFGGAAPWSLPLIALRAIAIQGSYVGNLQELKELLILVRNNRVSPIPIARVKFEDVNEALDRLRAGRVIGRAVLVP